MELATYVGNPKTTLAGIEEVNADELTNIRDELARAQSLQARANADVGVLLARFSEFEAHVVVEKEALRGQFREADTYAKTLEASLTAIRRDSARDLAECRDELARTQSSHERITAELFDIRQERDDLRQELAGRAHEAHQMHRDLKYCKADVAVKEAFISDLRKQLLAMNAVVLDRDRLRVKRRRLLSTHKQLLARQQSLETSLNAFRTYANSAGFRFTEAVIRHLRAFPGVFSMTRALVRRVVVKR
jgi:chromosome segregation ATPase